VSPRIGGKPPTRLSGSDAIPSNWAKTEGDLLERLLEIDRGRRATGQHGCEDICVAKKRQRIVLARTIGAGLAATLRALSLPFGKEMGARIAGHASPLVAPVIKVATERGTLRFWCPSSTSAKYAVNFLRYEPDTRACGPWPPHLRR